MSVNYRPGVFRVGNSSAGDAITKADIGAACYIVDDQTVAKTSGTNTRSPAGIVDGVDSLGVWVRFDEALTRAAVPVTTTNLDPTFVGIDVDRLPPVVAGEVDHVIENIPSDSRISSCFGVKSLLGRV